MICSILCFGKSGWSYGHLKILHVPQDPYTFNPHLSTFMVSLDLAPLTEFPDMFSSTKVGGVMG